MGVFLPPNRLSGRHWCGGYAIASMCGNRRPGSGSAGQSGHAEDLWPSDERNRPPPLTLNRCLCGYDVLVTGSRATLMSGGVRRLPISVVRLVGRRAGQTTDAQGAILPLANCRTSRDHLSPSNAILLNSAQAVHTQNRLRGLRSGLTAVTARPCAAL
jgi:hypothetical protein